MQTVNVSANAKFPLSVSCPLLAMIPRAIRSQGHDPKRICVDLVEAKPFLFNGLSAIGRHRLAMSIRIMESAAGGAKKLSRHRRD